MTAKTLQPAVNNQFYDDLGERWYNDDQHIIALLRAESRLKLDYVQNILRKNQVESGSRLLDIGCGAGFLSNRLAENGYHVTGVDQSAGSLNVARRHAPASALVDYQPADAYQLPFADASFDAVLLMDFLEHVDEPGRAIAEASRVLKPHGLMIFYTFNRTLPAKFLAIDAVELIARDCPKHFHVWHLFIKPDELKVMADKAGLNVVEFQGLRPRFLEWPFWSSLLKRRVHPDFGFQFTGSLKLGYMGYASKNLY
ncbi:MAG: bifunctional 2-polyprenyl-6-hydroxyphenol methylase/3-demethylubiquinol 3-O-methyltransferase UbiG [Pseudobdellovibrionaceae bacterium]|nr:bifunctional 2-polyprenyl-6-hydroxyphenol methylase/3-demethylubiquinol 3-O-methyltransferase UbiG [Pseudobdellovibrionaceae bacterium]